MSIKETKGASVPREFLRNRITIYSYTEQNPSGTLVNPLYHEPKVFHNVMEMLMVIEKNMDDVQHPQSMTRHRPLFIPDEVSDRSRKNLALPPADPPVFAVPEEWKSQNPLEEFILQVLFRSISGWEGLLECPQSGEMFSFHNELELLEFMDSKLREVSG